MSARVRKHSFVFPESRLYLMERKIVLIVKIEMGDPYRIHSAKKLSPTNSEIFVHLLSNSGFHFVVVLLVVEVA